MRSLFTRMFLAFAVVTVGATMCVSAFYDASLARRQEQRLALVEDALVLHGGRIAEHPSAASDEVRQLCDHTDMRLDVFVDGTRVDGCGEVPSGARALADPTSGEVLRHDEAEEAWLVWRPTHAPRVRIVAAIATTRPWGVREVRIAILVVVIALVSFLLARLLTRPIRTLRAATRKIAEGDTSVRVGEVAGAGEEIAGLAADFDRMTARIEALLEARETLLRDVSHELRSPLARLQVALALARRKKGDELEPLLDRMEREAERLGELVGLVLSMARLEQAREIPAPSDVRIDELVRGLAADASFEAQAADRTVRVLRSEAALVRGDAELLRQAAENVVRNALRFAPAGTDVEIELARVDGSAIELRVRDHGPGVPDEALTEIFRPFTRVEAARDRASGGHGIGLAITERAVRLHEGSVTATNAKGGGLCVTIRLPAVG